MRLNQNEKVSEAMCDLVHQVELLEQENARLQTLNDELTNQNELLESTVAGLDRELKTWEKMYP